MSVAAVMHFQILELSDVPGHHITVIDCAYDDAPDGGMDLCTPLICEEHGRSVWWCLNAGVLYCDSGPPDYPQHTPQPFPPTTP